MISNKNSMMIFAAAAALVRTMMSISSVNDIFATKYDKNKATNQANSCWNGEIYIQEHPEDSTNRASAMDGGSDISEPELSGQHSAHSVKILIHKFNVTKIAQH
jgi:hypothetical protein